MSGLVQNGEHVAADLTHAIIGAAIEMHKGLKSACDVCLADELSRAGLKSRCQVDLPVIYKERRLDCGSRIDLIVEDTVIVELKAVEKLIDIHEAQLLTYLRLAQKRVGLMINFNVAKLRNGIIRRVL